MICVYPADCTDFSNNGLGSVSPTSCTVTETLNGEWELTLVHPIDEREKWRKLTDGGILRVPVPAAMTPQINLVTQQYQTTTYDVEVYKVSTSRDPLRLRSGTGTKYKILGKYKKGTEVIVIEKTSSSWYEVTCPDGKHGYMSSEYLTYVRTEQQSTTTNVGFRNDVVEARQLRDQPFRVYRVVPELDKVTVYARHIFYDLLDNMIKQIKPASDAVGASVVKSISDGCLSEHDFTFYSDLESTASDVSFENINPVEALLGENGLTSKYGAELVRDWFDVFLVSRVGTDSEVQIREKKNLTGISIDVDMTDAVTRIMPTGEDADGNVLYLPELYIDSPNIGTFPHPKWIHLPVSEAKEVAEGDNYKSLTSCYQDMRKAAQAEFVAGCDMPTVTLKVDFVNCKDTEEYKQFAALSDIFLGDAVRVVARRLDFEVTMRMTQYTYDCLTRKYTSVTLGTAAETLEGTAISARQLASGSISGTKLMLNSIGSGHLQNGSVGSLQVKAAAIQSAHIQTAAITQAHIANALIETLNANAITAVSAKIQELAAGQITTDELYASIAMISTAQLTTANIINANIEWAQIESLAADIATISKAQITSANIDEANIDWAAITTLSAAVASMIKADIGTADIDWSHIKDLATDMAIITQGTAGELYIAKLAVTEANMVSLTVGELVVKGSDGHFYSVSVDENGEVVTTLKQVANDDVADLSIHGTEKLIEGSITARTLNVQEIFGDNATIRSLIAANIDVDTLFAREATLNAINAMDITGNTYLKLMVSGKADQSAVDGLSSRMDTAESSITQNASNIALKVSTSTYNSEKVYRGSTAPTTLYTNMLWLDTSVSPNLLKRYTGSTWVAAGAQEVKASGITIGPNNVAITTENFLLQLLDPSDNENVLMEMSANGNVGFKQLYADEVISDSVAQSYAGSSWLWVEPSIETPTETDFRSLGEAVQTLNNKFLPNDVTIYLPWGWETYEPSGVIIRGISGPGKLTIYGYGENSILNSYIKVHGCFAHICFQNLYLRESRTLNGSNRQPYLCEVTKCHFVEFTDCTLDANAITYDSVYARSSHVFLYNCGLYNALQGLECYLAQGNVKDCCGSCSWAMVSYASLIIASGTVPAGSRGTGENGLLYANSVTTDYGTAIPTVTPDETGILYATTTKSWRGSWRTDTLDVIQGVYYDSGYNSSLNWNRGCMWFGNAQNLLWGCTVKSATLTLHRKTGSGSSAAKKVYLCAISNTSASGTPSIVKNFGSIGTIGRDKQVTFSIPVDAVQGLADGYYGGLCLYETPYDFGSSTYSNAYMRMSGTDTNYEPYIECVFSGSTAVG